MAPMAEPGPENALFVALRAPCPVTFDTGGVHIVYSRTGADMAVVVLGDATGGVDFLVLIGTVGISRVPDAWVADPSIYPAWYATYGYPSWYAGAQATVPPPELSKDTIAALVVVLAGLAILVRFGVSWVRSRR